MARLKTHADASYYSRVNCIAVNASAELPSSSIEKSIWNNYVELGEYAHSLGLHELSDKMFKAALHDFKEMQSEETDLSKNVWTLAKIYIGQQKYKMAERLLKEKLQTSETLLGRNNFRICVDVERLASFYAMQGEYAKAERLYKRALIIACREFGRKDIRMISKLRELASVFSVQGKDEKAEKMLCLASSLETGVIQDFCRKNDRIQKELSINIGPI